jgi:hypothetical protein
MTSTDVEDRDRSSRFVTLCFASALLFGCSGNGHVQQKKFFAAPGDDVVNCACNLSFANENCTGGTCSVHLALRLCLPPSLQTNDTGAAPVDGGVDPHSAAVDQYCRDTATHVVYHMIKVFNGGWCDYKAPFAPDGGIGDSVSCFAQDIDDGRMRATTIDDGTCRTSCAPVDCDYATNCGSDVQDADGTVHPERCRCSIISKYGCPGDPPSDLPTPLFCRPPS